MRRSTIRRTFPFLLAAALAQKNHRTLLIDLDPQANSSLSYLEVEDPGPSVYDLLVDSTVQAQDVIRKSPILNLDIAPARISLAKFESKVMGEFDAHFRLKDRLKSVLPSYSYVIIDTPPVLIVPDARVIGRHADAVLYVVHWNKTSRAQVDEGLKSLANVDIKVSGLVLSQVDIRKASSYGGYYSDLYKNYGGVYYRN